MTREFLLHVVSRSRSGNRRRRRGRGVYHCITIRAITTQAAADYHAGALGSRVLAVAANVAMVGVGAVVHNPCN